MAMLRLPTKASGGRANLHQGAIGAGVDLVTGVTHHAVLKNRKASISLVQRHLKIGYNRAARMLEEMEKSGVVSSMSGSGQREILVPARTE